MQCKAHVIQTVRSHALEGNTTALRLPLVPQPNPTLGRDRSGFLDFDEFYNSLILLGVEMSHADAGTVMEVIDIERRLPKDCPRPSDNRHEQKWESVRCRVFVSISDLSHLCFQRSVSPSRNFFSNNKSVPNLSPPPLFLADGSACNSPCPGFGPFLQSLSNTTQQIFERNKQKHVRLDSV